MAKPKVDKGKRQDCLNKAKETLSLLKVDELNDYVTQVLARAKDGGEGALEKAMDEVNNEMLSTMLDDMAIKVRDTEKYERNVNKYMKTGLNLRNFMIKTSKNQDYNIENSQKTARQELYNDVFSSLDRDEIKQWETGKFDDEIMAVADGKKTKDPFINKIADIYRKYPEEIRNPRMVESDALAINQVREDRFLRNSHNASRIANAGMSLYKRVVGREKVDLGKNQKIWADDLKKEMDLEATAKNINALTADGEVDMAKIDKFLSRAFDNIINNRSSVFTKSTIANDQDALNRKKRQYIIFKDWSSFNRYNKKYGRGNMFQALLSDMRLSGNKIGLARIFGSSPFSMLNDLKQAQIETRPLSNLRMSEAEGLFKQLSGSMSGISSPNLAAFGSTLRAFSTISRLGNIVIQSLNDFSAVSGVMQRFGYSFWKPYADRLLHTLDMVPQEHRQTIARQMRMELKHQMGFTGNWADVSNMGDVMSKMSNRFYWLNGLEGWTSGLKLSAMTSIARALGADSIKGFESLHPQTQYQLSKLGISPEEWDVLRSKTSKGLFSLDNVNSLTNSELSNLWEKSDKAVTKNEYRSHLNRKIYGLFDTVSENASIDPGAYERMITTGNLPAGTIKGEMARAFMQFKSYPISYFRKAYLGGFTEMQGAQGKLMYALTMASSNFILGYMSLVLANWAMNKTTPAIADMPLTDIAMMLSPGLGVFVKILSSKNQDSSMLLNLMLTPSVKLFSDPFVAALSLATGNLEGAKRAGKDFASYANLVGTYPVLSPMVDHLMGKEPYLQPGQQQLFGA